MLMCRSAVLALASFAIVLLITATPVLADEADAEQPAFSIKTLKLNYSGVEVDLRYAVALPPDYDPAIPAPAVICFAQRDQMELDIAEIMDTYADEAKRRGWILISPLAPMGAKWDARAYVLAPAFFEHLTRIYNIRDDRFHLAGGFVGGVSAFAVGIENVDHLASIVAFPGVLPNNYVVANIQLFKNQPVSVLIDQTDEPRQKILQSYVQTAQAKNLPYRLYPVDPAEEPALKDGIVSPERFFTILGLHTRSQQPARLDPEALAVSKVLTDLHQAAAHADEETYFNLYTYDAVFLGTDGAERWTLPEFQAFATPHFQRESAWVYHPTKRNITVSPDGTAAWFDERLEHASYGECRGTGALRKEDGEWRITQYSLSIPVPNDLTLTVVKDIAAQRIDASP